MKCLLEHPDGGVPDAAQELDAKRCMESPQYTCHMGCARLEPLLAGLLQLQAALPPIHQLPKALHGNRRPHRMVRPGAYFNPWFQGARQKQRMGELVGAGKVLRWSEACG